MGDIAFLYFKFCCLTLFSTVRQKMFKKMQTLQTLQTKNEKFSRVPLARVITYAMKKI